MSTQIYWQIEDGTLAVMMKSWNLLPDQLHRLEQNKQESPTGLSVQEGVAVIPIQGVITPQPDFFSAIFGGGNTSLDVLTAQIQEAMERSDVDSVLYNVNSGGGRASGVDEAASLLAKASTIKPSAAQITGSMGSAAYYLGSQAGKVFFSSRTDMAGSIGTRIILEDTSERYKEMGIRVIPIHTGSMKSVGIDGLPITEEQVAVMQNHVDQLQGFFEESVQSGRPGIDISKVNNGQMFLAEEAVQLGLADGIQSASSTARQLMDRVDVQKQVRTVTSF